MTVQVVKFGFVGFNVEDVEGMKHHYEDVMGLPKALEAGGATVFSCGSETQALGLYPSSDEKGLRHIGFRIDRNLTLDDALRDLERSGVKAVRKSDLFPGIPNVIELADPDGFTVYLYAEAEAAAVPYTTIGVGPVKLSHVALFVADAPKSAKFYSEVMGFRWSDWCEDLFVFMRCNADHHSLNLTTGKNTRLWHLAWEMRDFSHIGRGCDILAQDGRRLLWGPGRHGMGHNLFAYHRDPDGNIIEFCADMDRLSSEGNGTFDPRPHHEDRPQQPKIWPAGPESSNLWGILPPPGFME